jgi:hypothetical protein
MNKKAISGEEGNDSLSQQKQQQKINKKNTITINDEKR